MHNPEVHRTIRLREDIVPFPARRAMQQAIWDDCIQPNDNEWTTWTDAIYLAETAANALVATGWQVVPLTTREEDPVGLLGLEARSAGWNAAYDHGTRQVSTKDVYLIADAASGVWRERLGLIQDLLESASNEANNVFPDLDDDDAKHYIEEFASRVLELLTPASTASTAAPVSSARNARNEGDGE